MDRNKRITKPKYEIIKEALLERIRTGQFFFRCRVLHGKNALGAI